MEKIGYRLLTLVTATVLMTDCVGLGPSGGTKPTENSVMIEKDDSVQRQSMGAYEVDDYTEEEMIAFLEQRISDYNSPLGKAASPRGSEGEQKLPAVLVSASLESEEAYSMTEHDATNRLVKFAQEIDDYNVTSNALEPGRTTVIGQQMEGVSSLDEKGKTTDFVATLSDGQRIVVKAEGPRIIEAEEKIMCVSKGCELRDSSTVKTPGEDTSFIVINQYLI